MYCIVYTTDKHMQCCTVSTKAEEFELKIQHSLASKYYNIRHILYNLCKYTVSAEVFKYQPSEMTRKKP